ncbi:gamma-glutamyltransferase [Amycolatopsis anabasis]|uniref:gamma-glutamyltransferase n=1 Tax=Amycolatopsis anabasis TaxID=1840409 RepID=UPI0024833609|nr:gamma-glutamyltransferase [Amycolatopsis anabasis]
MWSAGASPSFRRRGPHPRRYPGWGCRAPPGFHRHQHATVDPWRRGPFDGGDQGGDSVTVPGAVEGWGQLLKRFGRKRFDSVLQPAVDLAAQGFALTERIHHDWGGAVELLRRDQRPG